MSLAALQVAATAGFRDARLHWTNTTSYFFGIARKNGSQRVTTRFSSTQPNACPKPLKSHKRCHAQSTISTGCCRTWGGRSCAGRNLPRHQRSPRHFAEALEKLTNRFDRGGSDRVDRVGSGHKGSGPCLAIGAAIAGRSASRRCLQSAIPGTSSGFEASLRLPIVVPPAA
jgi:hypothetical protein